MNAETTIGVKDGDVIKQNVIHVLISVTKKGADNVGSQAIAKTATRPINGPAKLDGMRFGANEAIANHEVAQRSQSQRGLGADAVVSNIDVRIEDSDVYGRVWVDTIIVGKAPVA